MCLLSFFSLCFFCFSFISLYIRSISILSSYSMVCWWVAELCKWNGHGGLSIYYDIQYTNEPFQFLPGSLPIQLTLTINYRLILWLLKSSIERARHYCYRKHQQIMSGDFMNRQRNQQCRPNFDWSFLMWWICNFQFSFHQLIQNIQYSQFTKCSLAINHFAKLKFPKNSSFFFFHFDSFRFILNFFYSIKTINYYLSFSRIAAPPCHSFPNILSDFMFKQKKNNEYFCRFEYAKYANSLI